MLPQHWYFKLNPFLKTATPFWIQQPLKVLEEASIPERRIIFLTCYIGTGTMIGSVLHQSVVPWQLLWFTVLCPWQLRTLRWSILRGVVIQLKAFTLWSGFTWATVVRNCNSWIWSFSLSLNYCLAYFFFKPELPWSCI